MNDARQSARNLLLNNGISLERLWVRYWAQGGNAAEFEFEAYLYEALVLLPSDLRILVWALEDLGIGSVH